MLRTCAKCSSPFECSDLENRLREKIAENMRVPAFPLPTFCHSCRIQSRMSWRNERNLYRRKSDKSGAMMISSFPPDSPFPVFERSEWWQDDWDPLDFGCKYDLETPFFDQFRQVQQKVPRPALTAQNCENCDYCNYLIDCKDCYLSYCCYYGSRSLLYCYFLLNSRDCTDCTYSQDLERCFDCIDCLKSFGCKHCMLAHNCSDCSYLYDCRGLSNCFGCVGLRQKSYCLFNEQLSKQAYLEEISKLDLSSPQVVTNVKIKFNELKLRHPHLFSIQENTEDCTGDYIFGSQRCHESFQIYRCQDCIRLQDSDDCKDNLDAYHIGRSEAIYECYSADKLQNSAFFALCWNGSGMLFCDNCFNSSYCFGCVGLRNKKYCILNRQYKKEEYEKLLPEIILKMQEKGDWGQFFPAGLSPFGYNHSIANDHFPLTKDKVRRQGFSWTDSPFQKPEAKKTIKAEDLPERIDVISDEITEWAILCEKTGKPFKITNQELQFYRAEKIPIPHFHPDERLRKRAVQRNPRKLWKRGCGKCGKAVETSYSSDRPENVYCEECYLKKMY